MLRNRLTTMLIPLFVTTTGVAFATTQPSSPDSAEKARSGETFSTLHAVAQWSSDLSAMAEKKAKSDLVRNYARDIASSNANVDAKLQSIAKKEGVDVAPLDPQTEQGKSLLDRVKAETTLLESVEGDAFDKEYMTLVTNTQQSVINFLKAKKASAKDPDVKQYLGEMSTMVQGRLKKAQDVMAKIYDDTI